VSELRRSGRSVALISGESRDAGAETALALTEAGYDIVLTYWNKAARAEEVSAAITQCGQRVLPLATDITQTEAVVIGAALQSLLALSE